MLGRLGLVIHWLGLIAGVTGAIAGLSSLDLINYEMGQMSQEGLYQLSSSNFEEMSREDLDIYLANSEGGRPVPVFSNWIFILLLSIGPFIIAWATRFILTGNKSPLPWVANKETDND